VSLSVSFKSRKSRKNVNQAGKGKSLYKSDYKKPAGRPKIPLEDGCTVKDGWTGLKHCYTMFGAPKESCVKCGKEHASITKWRQDITKGDYENHPYVKAGYWSLGEYKKAMSRK